MPDQLKKITKEEIAKLPLYTFDGEIELITNTKQALNAAKELSEYSVLGFDTESRPSFKKGEQHNVCILQLGSDKKAYIFRINQFELPKEILNILENETIVKAGVAIRDDIKDLQKLYRFSPKSFFEIQTMAKELGSQNFGLRSMAALFLGVRISKGAKLTNWEHPNLTNSQINYAATDAWVGQKLYKKIKNLI